VATEVASEDQVTKEVRFCDVPSEYAPVAVNCIVKPEGMELLVAATAMDCSVAVVTVRVVLPKMFPEVAMMPAEPAPIQVASPLGAIMATEGVSEDQATEEVRFCDVPSEYVPIAMNCIVKPAGMDGLAVAATAMDCNVAAVTVRAVLPEMLPEVALMSAEPIPMLVTRPLGAIMATEVVPEVQITEDVIFCDVPSEYVPVAVSCIVRPAGTDGLAGATAMD
jgi:hypothetical protein